MLGNLFSFQIDWFSIPSWNKCQVFFFLKFLNVYNFSQDVSLPECFHVSQKEVSMVLDKSARVQGQACVMGSMLAMRTFCLGRHFITQ